MTRYSFILLAALFFPGGCRNPGYTPEEEAAARSIMIGRPFYDSGKGTPAEYITNLRGRRNHEGAVLRGDIDYAAAVRELAELKKNAELGFSWPHPIPAIGIPRLEHAPRIDGTIDADEWRDAALWQGGYILNESEQYEFSSVWLAGWRDGCFYFAADFHDKELQINSPPEPIHLGDSLELFIRPDEDESIYFEYIVNPAGDLWGRKHAFSQWGGSSTVSDQVCRNFRHAARKHADGFSVEIAIPFEFLHADWVRKAPQPGDHFRFMPVRTDRNGEDYTKSTPVPFLYDGHNVFGYFRAHLL